MLKLSVTEGLDLPTGWKTITISNATDGDWNGTRYIDLHFEGLPESVKCRIWSKENEETKEDFGIGNLFHYADAGLTEVDGGVTIDDNTNHLKGKSLNVFFYENENGYTDAAQRVVPVVREGFSESYVEKLKTKTEAWVHSRTNGTTTHVNGTKDTTVTEGEAVPF